MTSPFRIATATLVLTALFGAGCRQPVAAPRELTGPRVATFDNVSPKEATAKINLVPGSTIETRQTFLGFGAKVAAALAGEKKEGTRVIVVERFAPRQTANLSWKLSSKVEAESSVKAREEATRLKKPVPEPVMVDSVAIGKLIGVNLNDAHMLFPPSYWQEKDDASAFGTSGIWVSGNVYDDLDRNRVSTLDFGLFDPALQGAVGTSSDFKDILAGLERTVKGIEDRVDVFKLSGEKDLVEWPLKVNGKDITVEAIRAKNWFGEIVVLHNSQNPLVLKATFNPAASLISGLAPLKALFGYEVTSLGDVQE